MTNVPHASLINLQEVTTRNDVARQVVAGFLTATPSEIWSYLDIALTDTVILAAHIRRLRTELDDVRLHRANLAAAALATIDAYRDGEPDSISYLCDELTAQGYEPRGCA